MKVKRIVSALCCTALIAATAIPLAACGGAKELKKSDSSSIYLGDYVEAYSRTVADLARDQMITVREIGRGVSSYGTLSNGGPFIRIREQSSSDIYSVFNTETGQSVIGNHHGTVGSFSKYVDGETVYFAYAVNTTTGENPVTTYDIYSENGVRIAADAASVSSTISPNDVMITTGSYKVDGSSADKNDVWKVTYMSGENEVSNYFAAERDKTTNESLFLTNIQESRIHFVDDKYQQGQEAFSAKQTLAEFIAAKDRTKVRAVDGEIADYTVTTIGSEWIFNKGDEEVFRVDNTLVQNIGLVGNKIYYTKDVQLASDSKDADVTIATGASDMKAAQEIHKLDLSEKKEETLKINAGINSIESCYNINGKKYDALKVDGYKLIDGVAQSEFVYLVDEKFEVGLDAAELDGVSISDLKKINNYLVYQTSDYNYGYKIYNNDGTLKCEFDKTMKPQLYDYSERIKFEKDGKIGFANLDGEVVVEPIYSTSGTGSSTVTLYNNAAYLYNTVTGKKVSIDVQRKSEKELENKTASNVSTTISMLAQNPGFYTKKERTRVDENSYETTWYIGCIGGGEYEVNGFTGTSFPTTSTVDSDGNVYAVALSEYTRIYFLGFKY